MAHGPQALDFVVQHPRLEALQDKQLPGYAAPVLPRSSGDTQLMKCHPPAAVHPLKEASPEPHSSATRAQLSPAQVDAVCASVSLSTRAQLTSCKTGFYLQFSNML